MLLEIVMAAVVSVLTIVMWNLRKLRGFDVKQLEVKGMKRPLGTFEKFMITGFGLNANIAHACIISSKQPLSSAHVQKAAQKLADRYPLLRSRVDQTDPENPCFIPMVDVVVPMETVTSTTSWQDFLEEILFQRYNTTSGPLWSLYFLPEVDYKVMPYYDVKDSDYPYQSAVVFGFHHAIIDGCSRIRLADYFLTYLDDAVKGVDTQVEPVEMLPAMEYYIADKITPGLGMDLFAIVSQLLMVIPGVHSVCLALFGKRTMYTEKFGMEEDRNPDVQKKTCLIPVEFSREETSRLLVKCRENGTTIHGAIQTSVSLAFAKLLQGGEITEEMVLPVSCTINLRPLIKGSPVPPDCLGSYFVPILIEQSVTPIRKTPEDFWKMASQATELVKGSLKSGRVYDFIKFFKRLAHLKLTKDSRYPVLSAFTNLGNCSFLDRGLDSDVRYRAMHSCTAEHDAGPVFSVRVVTFSGRMFLTVVYYSNVTTKERAMQFTNIVREYLKSALE